MITTVLLILGIVGACYAGLLLLARIAEAADRLEETVADIDEPITRCECGKTYWSRGAAAAGMWHDNLLCQPERERIS